jgi:hypothetical protein
MSDEEGIEQQASLIHRDSDPVQKYMRCVRPSTTSDGFDRYHTERINDAVMKSMCASNKDE